MKHADIIALFAAPGANRAQFGDTALAAALGLPISTVRSWRVRGGIPIERWRAIIAACPVTLTAEDFVP